MWEQSLTRLIHFVLGKCKKRLNIILISNFLTNLGKIPALTMSCNHGINSSSDGFISSFAFEFMVKTRICYHHKWTWKFREKDGDGFK